MTLRRYVYAYDATAPSLWLDRYLATDLPQNHAAALAPAQGDTPAVTLRKANARAAWEALYARMRGIDLLAPAHWAVASAEALQGTEAMPAQMRAFLLHPPSQTAKFVHYADVERAVAYLREAASESLATISALPTAEAQREAVVRKWRYFAMFWRAMNLRPFGWEKLRARWETQIGGWQWYGWTHPTVGAPLPASAMPRGAQIRPPAEYPRELFARRPTRLDMARQTGAWRFEIDRRYRAVYGEQAPIPAHMWLLGTADTVRQAHFSWVHDPQPCTDYGYELGPTGCTAPSGDAHPIWLTNAGLLAGGIAYPPDLFTTRTGLERIDCVRRSLVDGTASGPDPARGSPGPNWLCGGFSKVSITVGIAPGGAPLDQFLYAYLPPFLWYAQLIEPLIQYLLTVDPLQLVMEMQLDVVGKNTWTIVAGGGDASSILSMTLTSGLRAAQVSAASLNSFLTGVGIAAGVAAAVNPIAGAVIGALGALADIFHTLSRGDPGLTLDVFGRMEAAIEHLAMVESGREVDRPDVMELLAGLPPVVDEEMPVATAVGGPPPPSTAQRAVLAAFVQQQKRAERATLPPAPLAPTSSTRWSTGAKWGLGLALTGALAGGTWWWTKGRKRR